MAKIQHKIILVSKFVIAAVSSVRLLPHLAVFVLSPRQEYLRKDLNRYGFNVEGKEQQTALGRIFLFIRMMTFIAEYRNVFYFRHKTIGHVLGILCRPMDSLRLNAKTCGPGLFIQHGYGTLVSADAIGAHCTIAQAVTVGYVNNSVDRPRIGNNVWIGAGARVLGAVTVGDNAFVSANSLVISDVPAGATVIGVPSKVIAMKAR